VPRVAFDAPLERRASELRASGDGRIIEGTVVRYGDVADLGPYRERFESGALVMDDSMLLNIQHDRGRPVARLGTGSLTGRAGGVEMRAEVVKTRAGEDALEAVRVGLLRGLSMEFRSIEQRWEREDEKGLRIVEKAVLHGVALVDKPAYPLSELRHWMWPAIPSRAMSWMERRRG